MRTARKGRFSGKAKELLGAGKPTGLSDFLNSSENNEAIQESGKPATRQAGKPEIRQTVITETRTSSKASKIEESKPVREEFRCTEKLAERLRRYSFEKRMKKTDIITKALEDLFDREGF